MIDFLINLGLFAFQVSGLLF